jgi:hypothetical protein
MGISLKITEILAKAVLFEKRALRRFAGMHHNFVWALNDMLPGDPSTPEEVQKWFDKNQSQLGNVLEKGWDLNNRQGGYFLSSYLDTNDKGQDIYGWITLTTTPPENADVRKSAVLQPEGKIPRLWLWVGPYVYNNQQSKLDLDLSHNEFLVDAITGLFYEDQSEATLQKISKFLKDNKAKVNRIRSQFSGPPKFLGGGADGRAYSINPHTVLKLFRDEHAFNHALKSVERLHKNPELAKTEAMIYDVGVLGTYNNEPLYYYVIEQMKPVLALPSSVQGALGKIVNKFIYYITDEKPSKWRALKKHIADPQQHAKIKEEVLRGAKEMVEGVKNELPASYFRSIEENAEVRPTWLQSLAEELLMKYLTSRTDLHLGNIGLTNYGEFRYYDPAYGDWQSDINAPR